MYCYFPENCILIDWQLNLQKITRFISIWGLLYFYFHKHSKYLFLKNEIFYVSELSKTFLLLHSEWKNTKGPDLLCSKHFVMLLTLSTIFIYLWGWWLISFWAIPTSKDDRKTSICKLLSLQRRDIVTRFSSQVHKIAPF